VEKGEKVMKDFERGARVAEESCVGGDFGGAVKPWSDVEFDVRASEGKKPAGVLKVRKVGRFKVPASDEISVD
jgi:hypothetical protein